MIRSPWLVVLVLGSALFGAAAGSAAQVYSDEQLELARRIGGAVAMSRICNGTVPTTAVIATLEAGGLTEQDILGDTAIRRRIESEAEVVMSARKAAEGRGKPRVEIVEAACRGFRESFGPGWLQLPERRDDGRR